MSCQFRFAGDSLQVNLIFSGSDTVPDSISSFMIRAVAVQHERDSLLIQ